VTSYAMVGDRERILAAGATGYIEKPIDPETFVEEIRRYFEMNILIVDDNAANLYLLEALLKGNGHEVQSAANGAEALEKLKSCRSDLIISDILMPVMDGFDLCRKVKTDEGLRDIPLIIYTATYTSAEDEAFALKIGADRFIIKPCEPDALMEAIQDVMASVRSKIASTPERLQEEEMFRLHTERLVQKLERKIVQLEKEAQARHEAEETLQASEKTLKAVFESAMDGILVADMKTERFVVANNAICRMLGWSAEEIKSLSSQTSIRSRVWITSDSISTSRCAVRLPWLRVSL